MNLKISYLNPFCQAIITAFSKKSNIYYIFIVVLFVSVYIVENCFLCFFNKFLTIFYQKLAIFCKNVEKIIMILTCLKNDIFEHFKQFKDFAFYAC